MIFTLYYILLLSSTAMKHTRNIVFRCCHMFCFCFHCSPPVFGCKFLDLKLDFSRGVDNAWIVKQGVDQDLTSGKRWFCRNQVLNQGIALINTQVHEDHHSVCVRARACAQLFWTVTNLWISKVKIDTKIVLCVTLYVCIYYLFILLL